MNWYQGNIAEAVAQSKAKNAIFVVYVEGKDDTTQQLGTFINEEKIRNKLESDDFVAIKIDSESQAYMQFATIYKVVPIPSIFFIGKSGAPLEIGTGVITSADELDQKIDKVLEASGKNTPSVSASSSFIEQEVKASTSKIVKSTETDEVICEGDVCYKKPKESVPPSEPSNIPEAVVEAKAAAAAEPTLDSTTANTRLEETKKLLEQKRRERVELEKKEEKERELRRRHDGKQVQNVQQWQKEQELKELKDNIRRDRLEEQAARERIRAQIASDRAERANKNANEAITIASNAAAAATSNAQPQQSNNNAESVRLQFRFPGGENKTQTFNCQQTLSTIRSYVKTDLLPGTGIRDFLLATTYPKRQFTAENDEQTLVDLGLFPSAVILVITKESSVNPASIIARSGGLLNLLTTVFWTILSPVFSVYGYVRNLAGRVRGGGGGAAANTGAQKRANEELGAHQDAAKRRNLDRFMQGPSSSRDATDASTSSSPNNGNINEQKPYQRHYGGSNVHRLTDNRKDSDDENATWNGNSTQQQ